MTILEMIAKRNQAWEAAKAFVETKRDKDGLLSEEDAATYAQMEQKVQNYTAEIERMQKLASLGGFIPCPDHRLMPGTKFELVQYDAEQIKKIKI